MVQMLTNALKDPTTVIATQCALMWKEATRVHVNLVIMGMESIARVSYIYIVLARLWMERVGRP